MKKFLFFLLSVVVCSAVAMADAPKLPTRTVTGTVISAMDDEPLVGATVLPLPLGSGNGTATDVDGNFTLTVPVTCHEIQIAFVGMVTRTVAIEKTGKMLIKLSSQENRLEEVIAVAYGTAKRSEYTGSASVVKADQIADALVSSVTSVLTGKVSGVQTLSSNGAPGESPSIRIRGVGSLNASSDPLIVLDGVPFDGTIADIAPTDVESMTVLKDAASTALYGARGANGVVLITTKRGSSGAARITLDARWGGNSRGIPNYNVLTNTNQYYEMLYEAYYNQYFFNTAATRNNAVSSWLNANNTLSKATGYQIYTVPTGEYLIGRNGKLNPNATLGYSDGTYYYTPDDWSKHSFTNGLRQEYNLGIQGGSDRIKYFVSASYLGNEGIIVNSDFNRFSTRATVDYQAKTWLKIGTSMNYTYTSSNMPGEMDLDAATSSGNAFFIANQMAPVYPMFVRDAEGKIMYDQNYGHRLYDYGDGKSTAFTRNFMSMANPIGDLYYDKNEYLTDVFDGKWYATLTPIEGLTITGNAGYYLNNQRFHYLANPFYGQSASSKGCAEQVSQRLRSINLQALASYNHTFNGIHNMDLMVGYETYNLERESVTGIGYNLYDPTGWYVDNTIDKRMGYGNRDIQYTTRGILARAKYNYAQRYFGHVSYRRDSSSRFAPGHRWGDFFSVSAAWDIAKESFMEPATNVVDQLKFKASFGQNGNDNLGSAVAYYYAWQDQYKITGADGVWNDATLYYKGNKDITWEKSNAFNIGFDFSLFQGKLDGTIEYYQRQVSDMLFFLPTAPSLGYSSYPANVGSMRNYGFEIELNYNIFNTPDFSWSVNANLTSGNNKIIHLPKELLKDKQWVNGARIYKEGHSMYNLLLVEYAGVSEETGEALYWAKMADGTRQKTTDWQACYSGNEELGIKESRIETGNLMPKVYGGFGTTLYAYGVDFSMSFAYQAGGKLIDYTYQDLMHNGDSYSAGKNFHVDALNRWTPENTKTNVPRIDAADNYTNSTSTRFLISSDYLSLNNITLGYTLPGKLTRQIGIESIRLYGAAENVALWTKRRGLDPRQGYVTTENSTYSPMRTISGGIRVQF